MLIGGSVNYCHYTWLINNFKIIMQNPVIGVAIGSFAGMLINLISSRLIIYRSNI